jgi:hypothetical protein
MASKPKFKIPVHVFVYTVAFLPGAAYAFYWYKNAPSDDEHEANLREKYSHHIQASKEKHDNMTKFLQGMRDPNNKEQQARMAEVLRGGRGEIKRLHAVDESLYGTGESSKRQSPEMKKKKKKKKAQGVELTADEDSIRRQKVIKQSVAAVAVAGVVAACASIFLGGKRQ